MARLVIVIALFLVAFFFFGCLGFGGKNGRAFDSNGNFVGNCVFFKDNSYSSRETFFDLEGNNVGTCEYRNSSSGCSQTCPESLMIRRPNCAEAGARKSECERCGHITKFDCNIG